MIRDYRPFSFRRRDGRYVTLYRGLDGNAYKSKGEADIADWLLLNGIDYRYEDPYRVDTRDGEYGQYRPDFHIVGTDTYIEYFGIDRKGRVPPYFQSRHGLDPSVEYRDGMRWKRDTHKANGSNLVELYSYQRSDGNLERSLKRQLSRQGIRRAGLIDRLRIRRAIGRGSNGVGR